MNTEIRKSVMAQWLWLLWLAWLLPVDWLLLGAVLSVLGAVTLIRSTGGDWLVWGMRATVGLGAFGVLTLWQSGLVGLGWIAGALAFGVSWLHLLDVRDSLEKLNELEERRPDATACPDTAKLVS